MRFYRSAVLMSTFTALVCGLALPAHAAGKKPITPPAGCGVEGPGVTPHPIRKVVLTSVGTKAFNLPNGSRVDLAADLDVILNTAVTNTAAFAPTTGGAPDGNDICGNRIEIRAAVSTLELNAFEFGLNFGYKPSGENNVVTGITGKTNVRVGTVAMEFSVWECTGGSCTSAAATTASALTAGVNLSMEIDFATIKTGPDLVFNTPFGGVLRAIMMDGMKQLASSNELSRLSWKATVREFMPEIGTLIFDAGLSSRIAPNQAFVIYAPTPSSGVCNVFKPVARVHTTQVETVSSTAVVDKMLDPRGIQDGDVVLVRPMGSTSGSGR